MALVAPVIVLPASADLCVSAEYARPMGINTIGVDGGLLSSDQLQAAFDKWAACNGYGLGFPSFQENDGTMSFEATVTVFFHDSTSPQGHCGIWQQLDSDGRSHQIDIWTSINSSGTVLSCEPVSVTLAHELGHVLGLANSPCSNYMMGPRTLSPGQPADDKNVVDSECSATGENWTTATEEEACP